MTQAVREAVHRAIHGNGYDIQMLMCSRANCVGAAMWRVHALVWSRGTERRQDNSVDLKFPLVVCDACKESITPADLVDNNSWRHIIRAVRFKSKLKPDRSSLTLTFQPLLPMVGP